MNSSKKSGFTLVEILIVVVIIGILFVTAITAFQKIRENLVVKAEMDRLKEPGAKARVLVISKGGQVVMESPIVGLVTAHVGKITWTDDKGVSREYDFDTSYSFYFR